MQKSHETGVRDASNGAIRSEDSARDPSALNGHLTSSEESSSSEGDSHSILNNLLPDFEGYSTDPRAPPTYISDSWTKSLRRRLGWKGNSPRGYRDDVYPVQVVDSVDKHEVGYGKVASFQDVDPSLSIYRKFGLLRKRALLYLQDELKYLEEELKVADTSEFTDGDPRRLFSRRIDFSRKSTSPRKELIPKINEKLAAYDALLLRTREIESIPRPGLRAQRTLYRLVRNSQSLKANEMDWIRYGPDLASLSNSVDHGWFATLFEDLLSHLPQRLTNFFFQGKEEAIMAGTEPTFQLLSAKRFDILLRFILTILAAVLLLTPVIILFELQPKTQSEIVRNSKWQLLTIFLFTFIFSGSYSVFTKARRQEVFTATAAYCAVLVVFLGNTFNVA